MVSIWETLSASGGAYARRALAAHLDGEVNDFYLFAGIALEHAMKTHLAREHASFLAPKGDFKTAVILWRAEDTAESLPLKVATAGATEILGRVVQILPAFRDHEAAVRTIIAIRNGEAHMGLARSVVIDDDLIAFLQAVNALLRQEPEVFWERDWEFVRTTLDENAAAVDRRVQLLLSQAKQRYAVRLKALAPGHLEAFQAAIAEDVQRQSFDELLEVECPACESPALASGENDLEFGEPDYGRDGNIEGLPHWVQFTAHSVSCDACGLELDGAEEIEAAEMEATWENKDADVGELLHDRWDERFEDF